MSEKQCVNCPGSTDHTTAECWVRASLPDGYMPIPTAEQLADALENVRCFHDLGAELIAPELLANLLAAISVQQSDRWAPSVTDYDRAIHRNPDAKAWADFFVATFPGQADKHDLMIGWFANAMMAMHDYLKAQQSAPERVSVPVDRIKVALEAVQNAMEDAYNNAYQNCCGRGIGQCCGEPEPAWSDADKAIMDALAPAQRELSALLASHAEGGKV